MKIAYCIPGTHNSGGMERVLANKANYLAARGHEVIVITTDQRGHAPFFTLSSRIKCRDLGINYEANNGSSIFQKLVQYPYKQFLHRRRLATTLREVKPDITISMFGHEVGFLPNMKDGGHKVLEIHFSKFKRLQYGRKGLWAMADRWRTMRDERIVKRYERFVMLTEEDCGYWGNPSNGVVIPNASSFANIYTDYTRRKPIVLAVGRITYQKNFEDLVDIWHMLAGKANGWELHIIGGGDKTSLENRIKKLGLDDSVKLLPPTDNIGDAYREASILAMTSRYEGLPMTLIEAQTFSLPIVSYACKCGPKDVVTDGIDGFLTSEGNKEEFAKRLYELIGNKELRYSMSAAAGKGALRYAETEVMSLWLSLFDKMAK